MSKSKSLCAAAAFAAVLALAGAPAHAEVQVTAVRRVEVTPARPVQPAPQAPSMPIAQAFGRPWHLSVPGAAWVTTDANSGARTSHASPGSGKLPHELTIAANGTYVWKAFGERIAGRWVRGGGDYPVVLQRAYEGKDWQVRTKGKELMLWDGRSLAGQFVGR